MIQGSILTASGPYIDHQLQISYNNSKVLSVEGQSRNFRALSFFIFAETYTKLVYQPSGHIDSSGSN